MPGRAIPLVTGEIYHVFNRGIDHRPTFLNKRAFQRAINTLEFYQFSSPPMRLSKFLILSSKEREKIICQLNKREKLVDFLAFCLMPNHFHFLIRQNADNGISKFMSNFQNSFTRYFNTGQGRVGPLFLDQFKAIRIESDEQLLHISRYIHLNPYSSFFVKKLEDLNRYPWSSFPEYLHDEEKICKKEIIFSFFRNRKDYKKFVFDQADYQRNLEKIKHLVLEK